MSILLTILLLCVTINSFLITIFFAGFLYLAFTGKIKDKYTMKFLEKGTGGVLPAFDDIENARNEVSEKYAKRGEGTPLEDLHL